MSSNKKIEDLTRKEAWKLIEKDVQERYNKFSGMREIIKEIVFIHLSIEDLLISIINFGAQWKIKNYKESNIDITEDLEYKNAAKISLMLGFINSNTYSELKGFNSIRNKIVHKLTPITKEKAKIDLEKGWKVHKEIEGIFLKLNYMEAFGDIEKDSYETFKLPKNI